MHFFLISNGLFLKYTILSYFLFFIFLSVNPYNRFKFPLSLKPLKLKKKTNILTFMRHKALAHFTGIFIMYSTCRHNIP